MIGIHYIGNCGVDYASVLAPNANQVTSRHEAQTVEGTKQLYLAILWVDEHDALARLYGFMTVGSSIIFVSVTFSAYMQMIKLI